MWTSCRDVSLVMSKPEQRPADMALISSLTLPPPRPPHPSPINPTPPHFLSLGGVFAILALQLYCKHRQKQRRTLCKSKSDYFSKRQSSVFVCNKLNAKITKKHLHEHFPFFQIEDFVEATHFPC